MQRLFGQQHSSASTNVRNERRKVSDSVREQWEEWQREKEDVERRLRLVEMQSRVIAHVTGIGDTAKG
jgi:hypothetical protein